MNSRIYLYESWERDINEGYCLKGKNYSDLLSVCFRNCDSFTVFIWYKKNAPAWAHGIERIPKIPEELERFRLPLGKTIENIDKQFGYHGVDPDDPRYHVEFRRYKICDVTKTYLLEAADDLFSWVVHNDPSKPENISFFREDESLFMYSCTHEGYCVLTPREDEDIAQLTAYKAWQQVTQDVMDTYPL